MSMDMRPGFFLFEPSGWLRSATGSVRPGSVLPYSGWIDAGRSCPVLFYCVYSSLFQSIPVHSGLFRSIPVHSGPFRSIPVHSGPFRSILFYSIPVPVQSGPAQPGPVRLRPVRPVQPIPAPPVPSRPVPVQFSPAWPCPARPCPTRACLRERGSGPCRAGSLRADCLGGPRSNG